MKNLIPWKLLLSICPLLLELDSSKAISLAEEGTKAFLFPILKVSFKWLLRSSRSWRNKISKRDYYQTKSEWFSTWEINSGQQLTWLVTRGSKTMTGICMARSLIMTSSTPMESKSILLMQCVLHTIMLMVTWLDPTSNAMQIGLKSMSDFLV